MENKMIKRILTVQDISCLGQCSITVALPIISALGVECAIIPSAVLSTHTGSWSGYTFRDLTDDMPDIISHWVSYNEKFDGLYTGYIGNAKQFEILTEARNRLLKEGAPIITDPAMADNGVLYKGFDGAFVKEMAKYTAGSDFVVPNITEAAFMTGIEYKEKYDEEYVKSLVRGLKSLGAKEVILTGISYTPEKIGVCVSEGDKLLYHFEDRVPESFHGTGDVFASVFAASYINGYTALQAAARAAKFTRDAILCTDPKTHSYGVNFEAVLAGAGSPR